MSYTKADWIGGALFVVILIATLTYSAIGSYRRHKVENEVISFPKGHPRAEETWHHPRQFR